MLKHPDLVLRNAHVIDGTGKPGYDSDLSLAAGRIEALGGNLDVHGAREIECGGQVVAPAFVDVHSHDDLAALADGGVLPKLVQGVGTVVTGNCGHGCAPTGMNASLAREYSSPVIGAGPPVWPWRRYADFVTALRQARLDANIVPLVPHGAARISVMGFDARPASPPERDRIRQAVQEGLAAGAAGASFGLVYAPGCYADTAELTAIAATVADHDGVLAVHLRSEGIHLADAVTEMLKVAQSTGVRLQISHLKCAGHASHGRMHEMLQALDEARSGGIDVAADAYPYTAGSTTITSMFPAWSLRGGVDELLQRLRTGTDRARIIAELGHAWPRQENQLFNIGAEGIVLATEVPDSAPGEPSSVAEVARSLGLPPEEALVEVCLRSQGQCAVIQHQGIEDDVAAALRWPHTMIGSDGLPTQDIKPHPRLYGTFPRVLARYVRDLGTTTLPEQIRRMTATPAHRFRITDRGQIAEGAIADLVIFDPHTITDNATYEQPRTPPSGIAHTLIAGHDALAHLTPRSGMVITKEQERTW